MEKYLGMLGFILLFSSGVVAQNKIDWKSISVSEDDDFLSLRGEGTDRGYSSGLKIDLYYTKEGPVKFPNTLLMKLGEKAENLYGWGITQRMYTPNKIVATEIQYGERPYAGVTYFSAILISSDPNLKQKLTTNLSLGVIGKLSLAKEFQTWVHSVIAYDKPRGWDNQISNDIVLSYYINYERLLLSPTPNFEVLGNVQLNAGTLWNNMGLGIQFRVGSFNNYFSNGNGYKQIDSYSTDKIRSKHECYFYMKTTGSAIIDDATLQGGFFTHDSSPYVILRDDLNRFIVQSECGIVFSFKKFGVSFATKFRTAEFKGDYTQQVGNLTLHFGL